MMHEYTHAGRRLLAALAMTAAMLMMAAAHAQETDAQEDECPDPEGCGYLGVVPDAVDDAVVVEAGQSSVEIDVLANDRYQGGWFISGFSAPQHGAITYLGDGRFRYEPSAGFAGEDGFSYALGDRGGRDLAAVAITVEAAPTPAPAPDPQPAPEPTPPAPAPDPQPAPTPAPAPAPTPAPPAGASCAAERGQGVIIQSAGAKRVVGTDGDDRIYVTTPGVAVVDGRGGDDRIYVTGVGRAGIVRGGGGADTIEVGRGSGRGGYTDVVLGDGCGGRHAGRDTIRVRAGGAMVVDGGGRVDRCSVPAGALALRGCER